MPYVLGIDASTQSLSAIVIDTNSGTIAAESSINFGERLPQYNAPNGFLHGSAPGEVHASPLMWLDALELLLDDLRLRIDFRQIAAICGAAQQHGSVYLNDRWSSIIKTLQTDKSLATQIAPCLSRPLAPIWMDTSTSGECREIALALQGKDNVRTKSGSPPIERFTGPQIRRFFKHSPDAYNATARIHLVSSFLCSILSGTDAPIDTGDGAGMNLLNIHTWDWDDELIAATAPHLRSKLPGIAHGSTSVGNITNYFVHKFGFVSFTPVHIFTGDNPGSLTGMGASAPGKLVISLGTSDTLFTALPQGVANSQAGGHIFGNPMGGAMALQCFSNGSLAREAVKDRFHYEWSDVSRALRNTPAGNDGKLMLPFPFPEISPPLALNQFLLKGSTAFERWEEPENAIRACIEGQFLNMKLRTAWMRIQPNTIYLTGGASKNDAIAQVVADIFQVKAQRLNVGSSAALGAALRAAHHCLGIPLSTLEAQFCQPTARNILPETSAQVYEPMLMAFDALITESTSTHCHPS